MKVLSILYFKFCPWLISGGVYRCCCITSIFFRRHVLLGSVRGASTLHDSYNRKKQELYPDKVLLHHRLE